MKKMLSILFFLSLFVGLTSCSDTTDDTDTQTPVSNIEANYIGLSVSDAQSKAQEEGTVFRVVEQDGEPLPVTMDYRPGRINASVENDVVVSYQVEGEETEIKDGKMDNSPKTSEYIGLTTIEAQEYAKEEGVTFRVIMEDGEELDRDDDIQVGRINATVENGLVVNYEIEVTEVEDGEPEMKDYIGLTTDEAIALAEENEVTFRVVMEDGEPLPATRDFQPGRISAIIEEGVVVDYQREIQ